MSVHPLESEHAGHTAAVGRAGDTDAVDAALRDRTAVSWGLLILRVAVGVVMLAHGGQKLFGLWGGPGLAAIQQGMGPVLGLLVSVGEFFGGLGLIVGFLSRFSAAALIVVMIGAIVRVHGANGFFQSQKGYEYNWALIGMLLPILLAGPGAYTVLRLVMKRVPPAVE